MKSDEIAAIRARAEKATPGPWAWETHETDGDGLVPQHDQMTRGRFIGFDLSNEDRWIVTPHELVFDGFNEEEVGSTRSNLPIMVAEPADAEFLACARTDVPRLLDALEASQSREAALVAALVEAADGGADAIEALLNHYYRHTTHRCEIDREAEEALAAFRALLDQQPGRAAALADQCTRALDCTQRAGHDGWCTVALISEGRRCQAVCGRAKCWRPVGHDGVHEDRGRRWETEQSPALPSVTHAFEPMRQSDPSIGDICALCSELRERHPAAPAAEDR